jgi:ribosomal protein S18 acetylase RimI-like enzyme
VSESLGFDVRLAVDDDLAAVGELTVRSYAADGLLLEDDPYARRLRDAADRAATAELWVAAERTGGRPLGSVTFCPLGSPYRELARDTDGEFRMLAVDPDARGRGVGRALVDKAVGRARECGFTSVVLCSLPEMAVAQRLYASMGFRRDPALDWSPVEGVRLLGFRRDL